MLKASLIVTIVRKGWGNIEPEKEIVLTVVDPDRAEAILQEIVRAAELNEPRKGVAFVIPVDKVVGAAHFEDKKSR